MSRKRWLSTYKYILYALPILAVWFVISILPHLEVIPLSLYKWSPISTVKEFVGLHYYKMMFTFQWKETSKYIVNTLLYIGYLFVIQTTLAISLALALRKNTASNRFFRTFFFLPMVFSSVMVSLTWRYIFDPNLGILNTVLGMLGAEGFPGHNFFSPDWMALLCIVLVHIWAGIGYPITVFIAALQSIPEDLHEAGRIDGANAWKDFWHITFPMLLPTLLRTTMLTLSTGAMAYDFVLMLGSRLTEASYDTWACTIYKEVTLDSNYGMTSSKSTVLFVVLLVICGIQYIATKKAEDAFLG